MVLRKSFYIRWSAGRSPRVHEVNPGRDPSLFGDIVKSSNCCSHGCRHTAKPHKICVYSSCFSSPILITIIA